MSRSFSVALVITLCCQMTNSMPRWNPESDEDCVPLETLQTPYSTWTKEDRVFVCHITESDFDVYSYKKNEPIAYIHSLTIIFEEMSGLSMRFTTPGRPFRCTFSEMRHAQELVKKVHPTFRFSPRDFVLRKLEKCSILRGGVRNREVVSYEPLTFYQRFVKPNSMKFTFEPANGESAEQFQPLTFLPNKFRLRATNSKVLLVFRDKPSLYYILDFGDSQSNSEFMSYAAQFSNRDFEVALPDVLDV